MSDWVPGARLFYLKIYVSVVAALYQVHIRLEPKRKPFAHCSRRIYLETKLVLPPPPSTTFLVRGSLFAPHTHTMPAPPPLPAMILPKKRGDADRRQRQYRQ